MRRIYVYGIVGIVLLVSITAMATAVRCEDDSFGVYNATNKLEEYGDLTESKENLTEFEWAGLEGTAPTPALSQVSAGTSSEGNTSSMKMPLHEEQDAVDVDVQDSDSSATIIDVHVQDVQEEEIKVNDETFQVLTISDYGYTYEVGKPQMPVIRETVGIPDGTSVRATVLDSSYSTYTGYNVYPVQPPEFDSGVDSGEFVIDEEFYTQDVFYPNVLAEVGDPAIWRDLSVVGLEVNPVMFNPATGELRVYDSITVELEYSDGIVVTKTIEPKFARMYQSIILNYDYLDIITAESKGTISSPGGLGLNQPAVHSSSGLNKGQGITDVDVRDSDSSGTIIDVHVQDVQEEETKANDEAFQILTLSGYAHTSEVGKPQIPVIRETVGIPDGASVRATILDSSYSTYMGYNVYPVQPQEFDSGEDSEFVIDEEFYSQDAFYPKELVEVGDPAIWRELSVVDLQINPVMFNPVTGELRVYDQIKVKLEYRDGATVTKTIEPKFARMYQNVILNFDYLDIVIAREEGTTSSPDNFRLDEHDAPADQNLKFLSIRHDDCSSFASIKPLLDWHAQNGLPYESRVWPSGSSPTAEQIKNRVIERYGAHPELEYVLLVGDINYLPWNSNWDGVPSDYWFGCVAGNDLWPELAVGRISVNSASEVTQQVNKILTYEQYIPPLSGSWVDKALLVADKQDAPGKYQGCKEEIRTASYTDPFTFNHRYGAATGYPTYGDAATNAQVTSDINAGRGIVNYRGHGSKTSWGSWNIAYESFTTTNAHALANGDMTPVVFSITCSNAALDHTSECLAEAFVKDDDSAVAFLGAARSSNTGVNHDFDKYLFDAIGNKHIYNIGMISYDANVRLIDKYGSGSPGMKNVKMYLWLGDPALDLCRYTAGYTYDSPALTSDSYGVHLAVRGTDNGVWCNRRDTSSGIWDGWQHVQGGYTYNSPALSSNFHELQQEYVHIAVRGTDNGVWYNRRDMKSGIWDGWDLIQDGYTYDSPALASDSYGVHLAVRGTDNGVWYNRRDTTSGIWDGWQHVQGGYTYNSPALTCDSSGGIHIAVRGLDNGVWYNLRDASSGWGGWQHVQSGYTYDSPALNYASGYVYLAVRGLDDGVWFNHRDLSTGTWAGWVHTGGSTKDSPAYPDTTGPYLAVRGLDDGVWWLLFDWEHVQSGYTTDAPALTSTADDAVHVAVRGVDGGVWYNRGNPSTGWTGWVHV